MRPCDNCHQTHPVAASSDWPAIWSGVLVWTCACPSWLTHQDLQLRIRMSWVHRELVRAAERQPLLSLGGDLGKMSKVLLLQATVPSTWLRL